ncbi:hypothetical protein [Actinomadura macra]|uniref:hypothetical protein n=1 Tax=Actinomadura macra TaxID=46164 RepID=UPI0008332492|nr:hypothetical protein [Actinomadura macra]
MGASVTGGPTDQTVVEDLYQRAVIRVYGPWLDSDVPPPVERRRAAARVEHARTVLALHGVDLAQPQLPLIRFNPQGK